MNKILLILIILFLANCYTATRICIYTNDNYLVQQLKTDNTIKVISIVEKNDSQGRWHVKYKTK
jgi:uncharacterized lipoprotein YajG